ncbi:MAG: hypothetical protein KF893_02815 [Caldilineaceae bacterium]|nr:hypothetical protein [Caldilineaceae bacterium]
MKTYTHWSVVILMCSVLTCIGLMAHPLRAETLGNLRYVDSLIGNDNGNNCLNPATPCRTIQRAINQVVNGDTILVASGVYTYAGTDNPCDQYLGGLKAVVCIVNKQVVLRGGYPSGNWNVADPATYPTIIDGEARARGVYVLSSDPRKPSEAGIKMEGFIVQNGLIQGASSGNDTQTFAFGGGMLTDYASVELRNMRFENNRAIGGGSQNVYGGSASGGGVAIRRTPKRATLENIVFSENRAEGGSGRTRGGYGIGGGLYLLLAEADGRNLEFYNNRSLGGSTQGNGQTPDYQKGDSFGAGVTVMGYADVNLYNVVARDNQAIGGNAATNAGGAFGGAIKSEGMPTLDLNGDGVYETATLRIFGCTLTNNLAQGGDAAIGGISAGGALETIHSTLLVERCNIQNNRSQGGNGSTAQGPAGGGGLYLQNIFYPNPTATVKDSLIAHNSVRAGNGPTVGGGGGGIWLQGVEARLEHNTIVGNRTLTSPLQGAAILVMSDGTQGPRPAYIRYNIIANHTDSNASALHVKLANTANLSHNLFHGNHSQVNQFEVGTITGMDSSVMADPYFVTEDPNVDGISYQIAATSPAVDQAIGSQESIDIHNRPRTRVPDIGAYEAQPFQVWVFPTSSGELTVYWGIHPGIMEYRLTINCPNIQARTRKLQCGDRISYSGAVSGAVLDGLENYKIYDIVVAAMGPDGDALLSTSRQAMPTDILLFIPTVSR